MQSHSSPPACDLLIAHADLVVPVVGHDLPGGWVAVQDGFVHALGPAGHEPAARRASMSADVWSPPVW